MGWQKSVAKLIGVNRDKITVRCPFCDKNHTHSRQSIGSAEVVAGCHIGPVRCRSYAIPDRRR